MSKMTVGIPTYLVLNLDKSKHTMAVYERFGDPLNMSGYLKSCVLDHKDDVLATLRLQAEEQAQKYCDVYGCLAIEDFELAVSLSETDENGLFWPSLEHESTRIKLGAKAEEEVYA